MTYSWSSLGVAYIHINRFNENTNDELSEALKRLGEKNLQGLVLDLRGNPGGLLQEAVEVSDHFLEKSQLIVYHYGRHSQEKRYYTTKGDSGKEYPIVVLINRMTASAAEIVTGALQDHDRALVMGQPSFGKGLVQTVFPLSEHTGLALTTARYYTPSGRLIQRDYDNVSLYDYYYRPEDTPTPHTDVRLTDGGREVYGGGGITPDVKYEDPKLTPTQEALAAAQRFLRVRQVLPGSSQDDSEGLSGNGRCSSGVPPVPCRAENPDLRPGLERQFGFHPNPHPLPVGDIHFRRNTKPTGSALRTIRWCRKAVDEHAAGQRTACQGQALHRQQEPEVIRRPVPHNP